MCKIIPVFLAILLVAFLHPAPAADEPRKLDFVTDIRPIFESNCAKCHLNGNHKGGLDLSSREGILKGGESEEPAIIAHDSANSMLIKLVTSDDPDVMMPK